MTRLHLLGSALLLVSCGEAPSPQLEPEPSPEEPSVEEATAYPGVCVFELHDETDGSLQQRDTFDYDNNGAITRWTFDGDGDGLVSYEEHSTYHPSGLLNRRDIVTFDAQQFRRTSWERSEWDEEGRLALLYSGVPHPSAGPVEYLETVHLYDETSGLLSRTTTTVLIELPGFNSRPREDRYTYDELGRQTELTIDVDIDGTIEQRYALSYEEIAGGYIETRLLFENDGEMPSAVQEVEWAYIESAPEGRNWTSSFVDQGADGVFDQGMIQLFEDERFPELQTARQFFDDPDDEPDRVLTWGYDSAGNMITYERDGFRSNRREVGTFDYSCHE